MILTLTKRYWLYIVFGICFSLLLNWLTSYKPSFIVNNSPRDFEIKQDQFKLSFSKAVKLSAPSVVNLFSSKYVKTDSSNNVTSELFKNSPSEKSVTTEAGSGVIVSANGFVITNHHVIKGAEQIVITLNDGSTYPAEIVGSDSETDLSVLKIDGEGLLPITFGESSYVEVGDIVLAIGNPFGQGQSVSMGIISATGKDRIGLNTYENFIQTDAAINPGNSGGALVNQYGELVGINSAIFSRSGGSQGIGFAIPVSTVKNVLLQIVDKGYVTRGWLGIEGKDITDVGKKKFKLSDGNGVYVTGVYESGPAYKAGIKAGDILLKANDVVIEDIHTILKATEKFTPGSVVTIKGLRNSEIYTTEMVVQQRPIPAEQ